MRPAQLRRLYDTLPAPLRAALPPALEARARAWVRARRGPGGVDGLDDRLWGGFSSAARRDLAALADATGPQAAAAAWILSRWEAAHGDFTAALDWIDRIGATHPPAATTRRVAALAALYHTQAGGGAAARALLAGRSRRDPSAALIRAASWRPAAGEAESAGAEASALAEINAVFARARLQGIAKRDPARPLSLDNLRGLRPGPADGGSPGRVSVLVPAFEAEATLPAALAGLLDQSHGDLEILVIDDASRDGTADVAADFARADPRVRLIQQPENRGGYAARNRALGLATGDYLTVHDADDWSHPEKIALQMAHLRRSGADSNTSAWVRVTPELGFLGPARVFPDLLGFNDSAMLFRRALFERFGTWDAARIGADKELIWRFERLAGRRREAFRRRMVLRDCPLTFGRLAASSLTRSSATHVLTIYHGLRREYREAADFWHRQPGLADAARSGPGARGFFPAPPVIRPVRAAAADADRDLLLVGDFNFLGGAQKSALHMIRAARAAGLSAALLHYRRYDQDVTAPLADAVRRLAGDLGVRILAPGEALRVGTAVVAYPPVLQEIMDRFPEIEHDSLVVAVNQMAERDRTGRDVAYDPARVRENLRALLGSEGLWAPISERVRALMAADPRYPPPHADIWTPLIDAATWSARTPVWRGGRTRPAVGRHGRDHPLKWPADAEALRAAYCAGRPCDVRFLGGAAHARARLRRWPSNWTVLPFDGADVAEFLAGLDVFLHFPDRDYIEEFGRAPMEAMAVGVPVILPPEFEPTFGAAALYAEPEGVWPLVERLWAERDLQETRVAAGRAFVARNCDYSLFPDRLARLTAA